jgi:SAM-dependent methyltransferase
MTKMKIHYKKTEDAWPEYKIKLLDLIHSMSLKKICDIGGGANPLLDNEDLIEHGISYTLLDISQTELDKAPTHIHKVRADVSSPSFSAPEKYDLIFSKMLAEHIEDAEQFHKNVLNALAPGGYAVHFFPTLYTLPFLANYLFPERASTQLLRLFSPRDEYQAAKFPAYYNWCRGPMPSQIERLESLGFSVVEYCGIFGHRNYYRRVRPLEKLHDLKTDLLMKHPIPALTSFAIVVLQKA